MLSTLPTLKARPIPDVVIQYDTLLTVPLAIHLTVPLTVDLAHTESITCERLILHLE